MKSDQQNLQAGFSIRIGNWQTDAGPGDLLTTPTEVLVCPCLRGDRHQSGISRQIMHAAGSDLEKDMKRFGLTGKPFLTNGYRLAMRKISHVWHLQAEGVTPDLLQRALNDLFREMSIQSHTVVSLNSMNAAQYKIPYVRLAHQIRQALSDNQPSVEKTVKIVDFNPSYLQALQEVFHANG